MASYGLKREDSFAEASDSQAPGRHRYMGTLHAEFTCLHYQTVSPQGLESIQVQRGMFQAKCKHQTGH